MTRYSEETKKPNRRSILGLVLVLLISVLILLNTFKESEINITTLRKLNDVANRILSTERKNATEPKIPHQFVFVYHDDDDESSFMYANFLSTLKKYRSLWSEHFGVDNPDTVFLHSQHCIKVVTKVWPTLRQYYIDEENFVHKSTICRIVALYKYGGYFFDNDLEVIKPLLLAPTTRFVTVVSGQRFINSFIASEPGHPVLRNTLNFIEKHYNGQKRLSSLLMGSQTLKLGYAATPPDEIGEHRLMGEFLMTIPFFANKYPNVPLQNGTGCCCNFAIHDAGLEDVFFYSRTVGASDKCIEPLI